MPKHHKNVNLQFQYKSYLISLWLSYSKILTDIYLLDFLDELNEWKPIRSYDFYKRSENLNNTQRAKSSIDPKSSYQLGGTNFTAGVTNFEKSNQETDPATDSESEPHLSSCPDSE